MTTSSKKPMPWWALTLIFLAVGVAVGAIAGYFNLKGGVWIPMFVSVFLPFSFIVIQRRRKQADQSKQNTPDNNL